MIMASINEICQLFEKQYSKPDPAKPPLGNKLDPLDELIFILLTVMTEYGAEKVFIELKRRYQQWQDVLTSSREEFYFYIKPLGLVTQRGNKIIDILHELKERFGLVTLDPLYNFSDQDAEKFLISLPGIGKKVARCIMMYSLNRDVFPVDTHVYRICKRLGLLPESISWQKAHDMLQDLVPIEYRYSLHVNMVIHGREVCRSKRPLCEKCFLAKMCPNFCGGVLW